MKTLISRVILLALLSAAGAAAQEYPNKLVRIVVPYGAGGGTDTVARLMASRLSATFGQPIVVENKPGASANIGTEFVARAPADGYTLLVTAPNFTTSEALFDKLTWRFEDFIPVIHLVRYANVLVAVPDSQLASVEQLIACASPPSALSPWAAQAKNSAPISSVSARNGPA